MRLFNKSNCNFFVLNLQSYSVRGLAHTVAVTQTHTQLRHSHTQIFTNEKSESVAAQFLLEYTVFWLINPVNHVQVYRKWVGRRVYAIRLLTNRSANKKGQRRRAIKFSFRRLSRKLCNFWTIPQWFLVQNTLGYHNTYHFLASWWNYQVKSTN